MFTSVEKIKKRDGRIKKFDAEKIKNAINSALQATYNLDKSSEAEDLTEKVVAILNKEGKNTQEVEHVQDVVESTLIENGYIQTAREYIRYRSERSRARELKTGLMKIYQDITFLDSRDNDIKRENANIDGDTAMGMMLKYGSEGSKQFYMMNVMKPEHARAHKDGDIHIHDMDFAPTGTTTCTQIDLLRLFKGGFCTGHGALREPQDIASYAALACIAIQSNQNDQHGGQSIVNFDYSMAEGVKKTFKKLYRLNLAKALEMIAGLTSDVKAQVKEILKNIESETGLHPTLEHCEDYFKEERKLLTSIFNISEELADRCQLFAHKEAYQETDRASYQAMEALIHNLNTMHSRAGAQTPFSSINYGMDTSPEARMVIKNLLLSTEAGLGNGETPIFPIQIFRVKEGINYNPEDPNYDLFKLAMRCSAKRLFPNFSFQDAPFNLAYYKGTPETEIAYMGCRTRVIGNVYDPDRQVSPDRGNLSFTTINLPRLAIKAKGDIDIFFESLDKMMDLAIAQLLDRFEFQYHKRVYNFPFLMGQHVWIDSDKLNMTDEIGEILKHGTLSVGFIGLAETLVALTGKHHGESKESQTLGLEIISHMRARMDAESKKRKMNFTLLATPAEGLSGRFVKIDQKKYGRIPGVTDREYYTNSFHIPVYYPIGAYDKIALEAPYHALTNAGHISYIEMDGDPTQNLDAFEKVIRCMKECGIGYGSVNHPVDRDPVCGFSGIIGDTCPGCGRKDTGEIPFERIRRITGYLVGTLDRFNDAKRAEVEDRVKHTT